jgi:hydroxymethylpyrimidine/phosphomethylpyrimidine kinase
MKPPPAKLPCALTIAGSDSGGGAGIQADLKTMAALGVFGTTALTAVTAQNTRGVRSFLALPAGLVLEQARAVLSDLPVAAIKTGMLANGEIVRAVRELLDEAALPVVVDPVLVATSGDKLLDEEGEGCVRALLLPAATLVTPNLPEAAVLTGLVVRTLAEQREAARALVALGAKAALVKGGHAEGDPVDVLYDGVAFLELRAPRQQTTSTHGTGCTYAAAITALLARGFSLAEAVRTAHAYLQEAIRQAPGLGHGHGPVHHLHPYYGPAGLDGEPS